MTTKEIKKRDIMKKNDIFSYLDELESKDETLKLWGDLYRIEEAIINKIIETRKNKGLSQKEVALKAGLKQPAIARIENGTNSPQLDTLLKVFNALDINFEITDIHSTKKEKQTNVNRIVYNFAPISTNYVINPTEVLIKYHIEGGNIDEYKTIKSYCN
jgi:transcriptional regulator with XRE-family HTH domain